MKRVIRQNIWKLFKFPSDACPPSNFWSGTLSARQYLCNHVEWMTCYLHLHSSNVSTPII